MSMSLLTAKELQSITARSTPDTQESADILLEDWLLWFDKRAERFLTTAAKFGYTETTLDLPIQLAKTLDKDIFTRLVKGLRTRLPGCSICIVEEDYEGSILFKVEISWKE